jgi:nicotinate-nucleotide adenylyltransferase
MKVGLFFGSFNPIHTGHLIIANHVANYYADKIWFIVSPHNPLKKSSELLRAADRLELVKLAAENDNRFEVSNIEFNLPVPSYTINTLDALKKVHPQHEFYLIIGSDNWALLPKWRSSNEILESYNLLVYERPGFQVNTAQLSANTQLLKAPLIDISSSSIRKLIRENKSILYLVPEKVCLEILTNGYFR